MTSVYGTVMYNVAIKQNAYILPIQAEVLLMFKEWKYVLYFLADTSTITAL